MSVLSLQDRQITLKVVYYGPAAGGKTTSLQQIHRILDPDDSVELVTLATAGDKTLFFDFLPIDLGELNGFRIRVQGFTVPGQSKYALTRRYVLAGADAILFVANSDPTCVRENEESLDDFRTNLRANGLDPDSIPLVIQYNKRDLPEATPVSMLRRAVRFREVPEFETVATEGTGIFATFREATGQMIESVAADAKVNPADASAAVLRRLDGLADAAGERRGARVVPVRLEDEEPAEDDAEDEDAPADPEDLLGKAIDSGVQLSRLYGEVNVARRRLETAVSAANALNRFARRMLAAPAPDAIWHELHLGAREHVPCHRSSLLYRFRAGGSLEAAELEGHGADPFLVSMGDRAEPFLAHLGEAAHLSDRDAPDLMSRIRTADPDVLSTLLVPVTVRGRIEGAVVLYRGGGYPQFQMKDTRFLSSVANLAALGLGRALRERDVVELNRELEGRVRDRTARLTDALRTIRRLNAGLTERVQQRTAELDRANATLERTQDFLVQAEKMSSLARLASGIAHEINNPMAYVQGNLKALGEYSDDLERSFARVEDALAGDDPEAAVSAIRLALSDPGLKAVREDLRSLVRETSEGATRVVQIAEGIRNLAHLSTSDAGPVDVEEQIENALRILGSRLKDGVEVVREFGGVPEVRGYPVLLSQMFLNICVNALDAMDGRGRLAIRTRGGGDGVFVEIADDGPGIPEDVLPQVFEPFFTTKEPGKGTGLGLYTVYQIVERHGGEVAVDSGPDGGTMFTFRLPATREPAPEGTAVESEATAR